MKRNINMESLQSLDYQGDESVQESEKSLDPGEQNCRRSTEKSWKSVEIQFSALPDIHYCLPAGKKDRITILYESI